MAIRTYGLSGSGIDVDQMVKDMMKAQRASYDKVWQKKTQLEWKKADYNTLYTAITDFRNTVFDNKLIKNLAPKKTSSSNETAVTATAAADAGNVAHAITVAQLADGVKKASSAAITATGKSKETLGQQFDISGDFSITIKNGDKEATIAVKADESIYDLVNNINKAGVNVTASYDATIDRFFLATTDTGAKTGIDFTGSDEAGLDFLADNLKIDTAAANGKDAEFSLDGIGTGVLGDESNLKMATNSFTISGVTYNLKATGTATVAVTADIDKTMENVKTFINSYNSLLDKLNTELNETRYRDYLPLTDEQKGEMEETEITQWTNYAKSGMLRRDPILTQLANTMRTSFIDPVAGLTGKYNNASSIGITTHTYLENGKLYVDDVALRRVLEEDPEAVYKLFATDGENASQDGIAQRLYDALTTAQGNIISEAGVTATIDSDTQSQLAKQIVSYNTRLDDLNDRLDDLEDRYYQQFDAMEVALNQLSQQSSWLLQQFSTSG